MLLGTNSEKLQTGEDRNFVVGDLSGPSSSIRLIDFVSPLPYDGSIGPFADEHGWGGLRLTP